MSGIAPKQNAFKFKSAPHKQKSIVKKIVRNPVYGEVYSIQHYVIKFVSDLRQVGGFLRAPRFPPQIQLTATI